MLVPKPIKVEKLPSYELPLLQNSIVICKFHEDHEEYKAGECYALPYSKIQELKEFCYFVEKIKILKEEIHEH